MNFIWELMNNIISLKVGQVFQITNEQMVEVCKTNLSSSMDSVRDSDVEEFVCKMEKIHDIKIIQDEISHIYTIKKNLKKEYIYRGHYIGVLSDTFKFI